jgi:hypothetical protein
MNRLLASLLAFTFLLLSCNNEKKAYPETEVNVATAFIRDILDNKIDDAEQYLLKDTVNMQYFESFKQAYLKKNKAELENYRSADILINENSTVNDTVHIINYSNSYKKESKSVLKLVYINGRWVVDFKYTFSGNM